MGLERDADEMGFHLYSTSWGWRDELLDPCPMSQGTRILVGPLMFHLFMRWHLALRQGLAFAALSTAGKSPASLASIVSDLADSNARGDATFKQVGMYEAEIARRGFTPTKEDIVLYGALAKAGAAFSIEIFKVASTIPKADYELARAANDAVGF